MAITIFDSAQSGGNKTTGTTTVVTLSTSALAVNDVVVIAIGADNAGASAVNPYSSVGSPSSGAITWETAKTGNTTAGAQNDGVSLVLLVGKVTSAVSANATVTVTWSITVLAKAWRVLIIRGALPTIMGYAGGGGGGGTFSQVNLSASPRQIVTGDIVIGAVAVESATAITTADTDTTNGSWSTALQASSAGSGGDATKASVGVQYKIATAGGSQTWNGSNTVTDAYAAIFFLGEGAPAATYSAVLTGGGVITLARSSARSRAALPLTGGGVLTRTAVKAAAATLVLTGGGVVAYTYARGVASEDHSGSLTATGGGVVVPAGIKKATRVETATGGGVVVIARSLVRSTAVALTGAGVLVAVAVKNAIATVATGASSLLADDFSGTQSGGWPNADTGGAWTSNNASKTSEGSGVGSFNHDGAPTSQTIYQLAGPMVQDSLLRVKFKTSVAPAGSNLELLFAPRTINDTNYYRARFRVSMTTQLGSLNISRTTTGANNNLGSDVTGITGFLPDEWWWIAVEVTGAAGDSPRVRSKVWKDGTTEPDWLQDTTDSFYAPGTYPQTNDMRGPGNAMLRSLMATGSTVNPVISFDDLTVADPAGGGAGTGPVTFSGGGVVTYSYSVGVASVDKTAVLALTGGGVAVVGTRIKKAVRSQVLTGGGVLTRTQTTARFMRFLTGPGFGLAVEAGTGSLLVEDGNDLVTDASVYALTGGGVITLAYTSAEVRYGSVLATGGGVLTRTSVKAAVRTQTLTGGGVLVPVVRSARVRLVTATAGGVLALTYSKSVAEARSASLMLTGGGVLTRTSVRASLGSLVFTGGGVVATSAVAVRVNLARSYSVLI